MTIKKTQIGLEIFLSALALGIAGENLLFDAGWGLGAAIWMAGMAAAGVWLLRRWNGISAAYDKLLIGSILMLALCYGWRDAGMLKFATTVGLFSMFGLTVYASQQGYRQTETKSRGLFVTALQSLFSYPASLSGEVAWEQLFSGVDVETRQSIAKSFLLGVPSLLVFGLLLSAADERFADLLAGVLDVDLVALPARLLIISMVTLVAGALLRGLLVPLKTRAKSAESKSKPLELYMLETGIVLGLISLMFAVFVFMQIGYLYGGAAYIASTPGLTLAQYARQGFFELLLVASLALFIMMWFNRYFKPEDESQVKVFNVLVEIQVVLLLVILLSAAHRMILYTANFGLTEMRLYSSAFMLWLAFVLVWFVWTVLKGREMAFVKGSVLAGFFVVFSLHLLNPEAMIVRTNIKQAVAGATLDHEYLSTLSADAVPAILAGIHKLPPVTQQKLMNRMVEKWQADSDADWRSWNLSQKIALNRMQMFSQAAMNVPAQTGGRMDN